MTSEDTLNVGIYQPEARDESPDERLERLEAALAQPGARGLDLVACPELYMSGYFVHHRINERAEPSDGPFARRVGEVARRAKCAVVYGYPERDGDGVYNAVLCAGSDGRVLANHRKNMLPYDYEERYFRRGDRPTTFEVNGWKVGLLICYEVEFPEPVRWYAQAGCELVVAPTALTEDWPVVAHRVIPSRAFENGVYLAYANHAGTEDGNRYLGASVIASPYGEDLARAGGVETLVSARLERPEIARARARLPFLNDVKRSCYR